MAEVDFEQAVQVLRSHLGPQYEGMEADGRDDMKDVLQKELGYSAHQADQAIDAMIDAGTLHYRRATPSDNNDDRDISDEAAVGAVPAIPGAVGSGVGSTAYSGTPVVPVPIGGGYWEIGSGDASESGRKGQVSPE